MVWSRYKNLYPSWTLLSYCDGTRGVKNEKKSFINSGIVSVKIGQILLLRLFTFHDSTQILSYTIDFSYDPRM